MSNNSDKVNPKFTILIVIIGIIGDIIVVLLGLFIPYYLQKRDNEENEQINTVINSCIITNEYNSGISYVRYTITSEPSDLSYRIKVWPYIQIFSDDNVIKTIIIENQFTQNEYISDNNICYLLRENNIDELVALIEANEKIVDNNRYIIADVIIAVRYMYMDNSAEPEYYLISNGAMLKQESEYALSIINGENLTIDMKYWPLDKEDIMSEIIKTIK